MQQIDLTGRTKEPVTNHTSKGNQPKWHIDELWYKADHMGYEALAEFVVSELLKKTTVADFVKYDLISIKYDNQEKTGCVSENFRTKNEILIPVEKLHRQYFGKGLSAAIAAQDNIEDKIKYTVDFIEKTTGIKDFGEYLSAMLVLDAFFLNEDRHTNNIAVIRNEKTLQFRPAPVFDNGLSLLSDINDYPLNTDIYENIKKVSAKPFSADFDEQLDAAEKLYGTQLKFSFTKADVREILQKLQEFYDEEIIKRAEDVIFEQMRKYSAYF